MNRGSDFGMEDFIEAHNEAVTDVLAEWRDKKGVKGARQSWSVAPAARVLKIWNDYVRLGVVTDERGVDRIVDIFLKNIAKLDANTTLMGHTQIDPDEMLEMHGFDDGKGFLDGFEDFVVDDEGSWRISDYGLKYLTEHAFDLARAKTAEEKVLLLDRVLLVCHQRSDLASWFIEGGSRTLNILQGRPGESVELSQSPGR